MKRFLQLLFCSALLLGCEATDPEPDGGKEPAKEDIEFAAETNLAPVFTAEGGSATVAFTSDYDWSVGASAEWISVSPASGKAGAAELSITLAENTSGEERTGIVTITLSNGTTCKITVKQSFEDVFDTDATDYSIPAEGGTFTVKVATNMQYTVSIPTEAASWLSVADTRAMRNETLTFTATENTAYAERSATVSLSDADGNTLQSFAVKQSSAKCANNEILYTSSDGKVVEPHSTEGFGANIVSNTYENGQGKILFGGDVTAIGKEAFYWCHNLTSMIIPDSVTAIGEAAFRYCDSLTTITIPDSVTSIGEYAFANCSSLASITIPDSVTSIGEYTFVYCTSLTSITIPDSVTEIEASAFSCCSSLEKFEGKFASADNRCLIVDGVLVAFAPAGLTEYTIPDSVTSIGESAFYACSSLASITIPDSVTSIGDGAFSNCTSLTSITIPANVTTIGSGVFAICSNLERFEGEFASADNRCLIVDGVLVAFAPAGLTQYTIPSGVTTIGNDAFLSYSLTSITIPNSVTTIGGAAFSSCSSLANVTIPDSVTTIGEFAFCGCSSLASVTIGNGVTAIERAAFLFCSSLASITIGNSVTFIGQDAFMSCDSLTTITIPDSVTFIGYNAFTDCGSLASIYCKPTTPPVIEYYISFTSLKNIYVPRASVEAYKSAAGWSDYANKIVGYDF